MARQSFGGSDIPVSVSTPPSSPSPATEFHPAGDVDLTNHHLPPSKSTRKRSSGCGRSKPFRGVRMRSWGKWVSESGSPRSGRGYGWAPTQHLRRPPKPTTWPSTACAVLWPPSIFQPSYHKKNPQPYRRGLYRRRPSQPAWRQTKSCLTARPICRPNLFLRQLTSADQILKIPAIQALLMPTSTPTANRWAPAWCVGQTWT